MHDFHQYWIFVNSATLDTPPIIHFFGRAKKKHEKIYAEQTHYAENSGLVNKVQVHNPQPSILAPSQHDFFSS